MLKVNSILNVRVILPLQSISAFLMHVDDINEHESKTGSLQFVSQS
jgi:hypothetical protein